MAYFMAVLNTPERQLYFAMCTAVPNELQQEVADLVLMASPQGIFLALNEALWHSGIGR